MSGFYYLIPLSLLLGGIGLAVFLWSLRSGQYEDLDGAAERPLLDEEDRPSRPPDDDGDHPTPRGDRDQRDRDQRDRDQRDRDPS